MDCLSGLYIQRRGSLQAEGEERDPRGEHTADTDGRARGRWGRRVLMQLLAKEPQGSTITTRMSKRQESKGRHQSLRGSMAWLTSWFRSTLWNCERIHFCCFKNQFVILTYGSPRKFMNLITQNSRLAHYCPVQYWLHLHFPFPGKSNAEMSHVRQTKDNVRFSSQSRGRKRERERGRGRL